METVSLVSPRPQREANWNIEDQGEHQLAVSYAIKCCVIPPKSEIEKSEKKNDLIHASWTAHKFAMVSRTMT